MLYYQDLVKILESNDLELNKFINVNDYEYFMDITEKGSKESVCSFL